MLTDRFWFKVDKTGNCWEWVASTFHDGYGQFWLDGKVQRAHKVSYEDKFGKIAEGLELNHICRCRHCVNPDHLEAVTHQENIRKGLTGIAVGLQNKAKTHCPRGHEYTPENTYISKTGSRACKKCYKKGVRVDV